MSRGSQRERGEKPRAKVSYRSALRRAVACSRKAPYQEEGNNHPPSFPMWDAGLGPQKTRPPHSNGDLLLETTDLFAKNAQGDKLATLSWKMIRAALSKLSFFAWTDFCLLRLRNLQPGSRRVGSLIERRLELVNPRNSVECFEIHLWIRGFQGPLERKTCMLLLARHDLRRGGAVGRSAAAGPRRTPAGRNPLPAP